VKLFVLGAAASGKSTVAAALHAAVPALAVWDVDDEVLRLNDGIWPTIEEKNHTILPRIVEAATAEDRVIVLNSYMPVELALDMKRAGFTIVLLHVSEEELRRRHTQRAAEEGWGNQEWFEWNQAVITEFRERRLIDREISGERSPDAIARDLLALCRGGS
jgi:shikimate kinase